MFQRRKWNISNASGGTSLILYQWSPSGGSSAVATQLQAGTYTVSISDGNGCVATLQSHNSAFRRGGQCFYQNVSVIMEAMVVSLRLFLRWRWLYLPWSPGGATSSGISGIAAGTYTVTVSDVNNCTGSNQAVISQPTLISISTASTPLLRTEWWNSIRFSEWRNRNISICGHLPEGISKCDESGGAVIIVTVTDVNAYCYRSSNRCQYFRILFQSSHRKIMWPVLEATTEVEVFPAEA